MVDQNAFPTVNPVLPETPIKMPVVFVGHGSPMNAIEDNEFSRAWIEAGRSLPRPKAILCISAHWQTAGTQATAMEKPKTIYDFYGFPRPLYQMQYPAPGSPDLARRVQELVQKTRVGLDNDWGLDHGTWSVLSRMFPGADVPVIQLSLDYGIEPAAHYELGRELMPLRKEGVLILGSGNIVHNLGLVRWEDQAYDWAIECDERIVQLIRSGDHASIVHYEKWGNLARLAIPTNEHYLPMLYILALKDGEDELNFFAEGVSLGSISMRSFRVG